MGSALYRRLIADSYIHINVVLYGLTILKYDKRAPWTKGLN